MSASAGTEWPRWLLGAAILVVCTALAGRTSAQDRSEVDSQLFEPALGPHAVFTVEQTGTLPHLQPAGELVVDYLSNPVVEGRDAGNERSVVDQQLAIDVLGGIGLTDRGQVAVHLPVYPVNDLQGEAPGGAAVGDLRLTPRYEIVGRTGGVVGVGAAVDVVVPTGDGESFVGAPSAAAEPKILVDVGSGGTVVSANLGAEFHREEEVGDLEVGSRFTYRLGIEQVVAGGAVDLGGELYGTTPFSDPFGEVDSSPLEGILGAEVRVGSGLVLFAGSGGGLSPGLGAPEFRAFLGVSYPEAVRDSDGDGIVDRRDECPKEPEDLDGYRDSDGCPDPDNDGDGIPDDRDQCPGEPEDRDGDRDRDGCPEEQLPASQRDSDDDGIADADDECPAAPEDLDGYRDADGCADPDNDGDGIPDAKDECPDEAGLGARDGCPAEQKKAVRRDDEIENLEKIFFEYDKAVLEEESFDVLDQVGLILRTNPDIERLVIEGHSDDLGSERYNEQLSEQRARAVKQYLVDEQGIDEGRLETRGVGAAEPLVPNDSEENRKKNRRVEFHIAEQDRGASTPGDRSSGSGEETTSGDETSGAEADEAGGDGADADETSGSE